MLAQAILKRFRNTLRALGLAFQNPTAVERLRQEVATLRRETKSWRKRQTDSQRRDAKWKQEETTLRSHLQKSATMLQKSVTQRRRQHRKIRDNMLRVLSIRPAIWFFTLKKSGTTYVLSFLLNYLNYLNNDTEEQIDYEVLRAFHTMEAILFSSNLFERLHLQRTLLRPRCKFEALVHTHVPVEPASFSKTLCLTRNPLDSAVSSYYFHTVNRGKPGRFEDVLDSWISYFIKTSQAQKTALQHAGHNGRMIHYEQLLRAPEQSFRSLLQFLELPLDERGMIVAMNHASVEGLKRLEAKKGGPLLSVDECRVDSFVRSGPNRRMATTY